ncbi:uncharacterized protein LACBIDRAFT_322690 [Laccaria bicolor S238N-H82]|uniref:Predicted protein n=1 Tax=Laccaria bicolor (strain S238N-H82 / ATCC MYA-4686) TaxID=486041 RepID=B0CX66_LACBS|nr:uncharacterized protein LACBIDRAFT_322690 [Laccaria bicolor S238N-H82]EDR13621.1 predicted protein [Laccaria bicolor S238N-H82]|eukprot:XP_001876119.1 predicted protein [Laccaria bicolor S238N-H82]
MALVLLFLLLNILGQFGLAALVNQTIDDYFGDPISGTFPIYSPANMWQQGNGCTTCLVRPDVSIPFDGTWHDSTFLIGGATRSVSITFTGSAVYAFFITAPLIPGVGSSLIETHLNITLDGNLSGNFDSTPSGSNYGYNQLVYGNASLNYGKHTLVISSGGPSRSILEFDYVIYTTDDGTTSSLTAPVGSPTGISTKSSNPSSATSSQTTVLPNVTSSATAAHQPALIGAIVGGVLGGVAAIALVIIFVYFCFYRNRDRSTAHEVEATDQAIPAGPQTPRTLMVTPTIIDPFIIPPSQVSFSGTAEKQRHTPSSTRTTVDPRQVELSRRMQELQREMALLQSQNSPSSQHLPLRTEQGNDWRSNVELLRAEVERLRLVMHSSQGLTDRPPPDYVYSFRDEITSLGAIDGNVNTTPSRTPLVHHGRHVRTETVAVKKAIDTSNRGEGELRGEAELITLSGKYVPQVFLSDALGLINCDGVDCGLDLLGREPPAAGRKLPSNVLSNSSGAIRTEKPHLKFHFAPLSAVAM